LASSDFSGASGCWWTSPLYAGPQPVSGPSGPWYFYFTSHGAGDFIKERPNVTVFSADMTYNVFGGMLNLAQSNPIAMHDTRTTTHFLHRFDEVPGNNSWIIVCFVHIQPYDLSQKLINCSTNT